METQEKAKNKFYKQWYFWVIIVLFLALIGSMNSSNSQTETAQQSTAPQTQATQQTQPASAPVEAQAQKKAATAIAPVPVPTPTPAPHQPIVLLQLKGNGTKSTQTFTAPSNWTLDYTYDCSSFMGGRGNFQVYIFNADGSMSYANGVNQLGSGGSDTEYYHQGGSLYLEVNSECSWTVTAKG